MRSVLFGAAAFALSAASAATPGSDYSVGKTRRVAHDYGKCVVAQHPEAASEALLSDLSNREIMKRYSMLIDGDCLVRSTHESAKMSFTGDLFFYALADALVARELAGFPLPDLSSVPPLKRRALPDSPAPPPSSSKADQRRYAKDVESFNEAQAFLALGELGECVVRVSPAGAKALLSTEPETAAEAGSFDALRDSIAQCLPEGRTLAFGKLVLRGTIALNYYRLAHAMRSASNQ